MAHVTAKEWKRDLSVSTLVSELFPEHASGAPLSKVQINRLLAKMSRTGVPSSQAMVFAKQDILRTCADAPTVRDVAAWYQRQTKNREENTKRNRLLVKDCIGQCRNSSYNLPEDDHVYGHANVPDKEGAGAGERERKKTTEQGASTRASRTRDDDQANKARLLCGIGLVIVVPVFFACFGVPTG